MILPSFECVFWSLECAVIRRFCRSPRCSDRKDIFRELINDHRFLMSIIVLSSRFISRQVIVIHSKNFMRLIFTYRYIRSCVQMCVCENRCSETVLVNFTLLDLKSTLICIFDFISSSGKEVWMVDVWTLIFE